MLILTDDYGHRIAQGDTVPLVEEKIREYMRLERFDAQTLTEHCDWSRSAYLPNVIHVKSDETAYLWRNGEKRAVEGGTLTNLVPGESYTVEADGERIPFQTEDARPRTLRVDGLDNSRDVGGGAMKYGMVYRCASMKAITEEGVRTLKELGIRTELDLTDGESSDEVAKALQVERHSIWWYQCIFWEGDEKKRQLKLALEMLAEEKWYPVIFHCLVGRDRTGTLAFILGVLCGREEVDLLREHYLSFFSTRGDAENAGVEAHLNNVRALMAGMKAVLGEEYSLLDNTVAFLRSIGVKDETMEGVQRILAADMSRVPDIRRAGHKN